MNTQITISKDKLVDLLQQMFENGKTWGETYTSWFIPTEEDHKKKLQESFDKIGLELIGKITIKSYLGSKTTLSLLNKEVYSLDGKLIGSFSGKQVDSDICYLLTSDRSRMLEINQNEYFVENN